MSYLRFRSHARPAVSLDCSVPTVSGDLMRDAGFEAEPSEIPYYNGLNLVYPSDPSTALEAWTPGTLTAYPWYQIRNVNGNFGGGDANWSVSTASPRTGTHHARIAMYQNAGRLYAGRYMHCVPISSSPFGAKQQGDVVAAGSTVTASAYVKADNLGQQGYFRIYLEYYDVDMQFVGYFNSGGFPVVNSVTGSYVQYSETGVVPAGAAYVDALFHTSVEQVPAPTGNVTFDLDDAALSAA